MKRGEVYWAQLTPRSGPEQTGRRPVLLISHDAFNRTEQWRSLIVIPFSTTRGQARRGSTAIEIPAKLVGLNRTSYALCHQITTLDRDKLGKLIGTLPVSLLRQVEEGVKATLDLD